MKKQKWIRKGIAMSVDCERDMREMFLWYQKYLDNRKVLYRNKNK